MIQIYNPLSNIWLSVFVASLPIFVFLTSLLVLKLKGIFAAFLTVLVSSIIALTVYKMPFIMVLMSFVQGFLTALIGLMPIPTIKAVVIATGPPKPIAPSKNEPKQYVINTT